VLALLLAAGVTYSLSQTLILPAMPALVRTLGADPLAVSWLLTAYLVAASVATPVIGRLGDLRGRGRVLTCVMALFCAGAVLCAVGRTLPLVIAGRVLQGVAGGVFPLAYGIIRDRFPEPARMRAIGSLSVSLGVGAALGPALSGVVVDHLGPSAIFWIGMLGAVPALAAWWLIPDRPAQGRAGIDWWGAALLAGALTAALVLVTQGNRLGWSSAPAVGLAMLSAGLAAAWLAVERRRSAPLVDLAILGRRTVALANGAAAFVGCGIFIAYVPLAPIAEAPRSTGYGFGLSVALAGALLVPHGLAQVVAGPWTGSLCARIGPRRVLIAGTALNTVAMLGIARVHTSPAAVLSLGGVLGVGQALALTAMANLVIGAVGAREVGVATGLNSVMRTMGMAAGSAISAGVLAAGSHGGLPSDHAYTVAFALAACATAGAVACGLAIRRPVLAPALAASA
jgi:MFS family permease